MTDKRDPTDLSFTRNDVEELAHRISAVAGGMPEVQWRLLLTIFAAAAGHVQPCEDKTTNTFPRVEIENDVLIEDPCRRDLENLRKQLLNAYMPGKPPHHGLDAMIQPPKDPSPPEPPSGQ